MGCLVVIKGSLFVIEYKENQLNIGKISSTDLGVEWRKEDRQQQQFIGGYSLEGDYINQHGARISICKNQQQQLLGHLNRNIVVVIKQKGIQQPARTVLPEEQGGAQFVDRFATTGNSIAWMSNGCAKYIRTNWPGENYSR